MQLRSVILFFAATLLSPLSRAVEKTFDVTGVIRAPIDAEYRILVSHENVPGFMPAMTMRFTVANPAEAMPLQSGDVVSFRLHIKDTTSSASDFLLTGHESSPNRTQPATSSTRRLGEGDAVPEFSLLSENR